jgi:probable rRNA maturation factor
MLIESSKIKMECLESFKGKNPFGDKRLIKDLKSLLEIFEKEFKFKGISQLDVSLTLCGKKRIQSLNRVHRKKDKITDVLSFPVHDLYLKKKLLGYIGLGDIFICLDVAQGQAKEFKISVREEIIHLFVHGFLHLLGYDHEISKKEEKKMFALERNLISRLKD